MPNLNFELKSLYHIFTHFLSDILSKQAAKLSRDDRLIHIIFLSYFLIQYDPIWSLLKLFDPIWLNLIPSDPIWSSMILYGPIQSYTVHQFEAEFVSICSSSPSTASATSIEAEQMRPPPPPHELHERRRSNSASPSDKLLLKRAASYAGLSGLGAGAAAGSLTTNCPSPLAGRPKSSTLGKAL